MGEIIALPRRGSCQNGTVHVFSTEHGFEIGHESSSGDSWGHFDQFAHPQDAISAAYCLNRDVLGGACEVSVSSDVLAALPSTPAPDLGEF